MTYNANLFPPRLSAPLQPRCRLRNASAPASPPTVSVGAARITAAKSTRPRQASPVSGGTPRSLMSIPSTQTHTNASKWHTVQCRREKELSGIERWERFGLVFCTHGFSLLHTWILMSKCQCSETSLRYYSSADNWQEMIDGQQPHIKTPLALWVAVWMWSEY